MYSSNDYYETIEEINKPISTCLLDQMKNDADFMNKNPRIDDDVNLTDIDQVFETLKSFEPKLNEDSSVQVVTKFLKKATDILQRAINIVDINGEEKVFKFKSAKNIPAKPYHLCFVQVFDIEDRSWLSITSKNVENTQATQKEHAFDRIRKALSNSICHQDQEVKKITDLLDLITEESKIAPRGINSNQILLVLNPSNNILPFFPYYRQKLTKFCKQMSGSFHFSFFGHSDQKTEKKSAVIFRQTADFLYRK